MSVEKKYSVESLFFLSLKQSFVSVFSSKLKAKCHPNFMAHEKTKILLGDFEQYLQRINFRFLNCEKVLVIHTHSAVAFFNLEWLNCPKKKDCFSHYFQCWFPITKIQIINECDRFLYTFRSIARGMDIECPIVCFHHSEHVLDQLESDSWESISCTSGDRRRDWRFSSS